MFGILNLDKPSGWTSRDVVNRVQRLVRPAKAGHAGTLDPLATGVLVVCVGAATRLISYVQQLPKEYHAKFLLGRTSPSEDTESEVTVLFDAPEPTLVEIEAKLPQFLGEIDQRPPAYSAVKLKGRRAYERARKGETVDLQPRPVQIYHLRVASYVYPELQLEIQCGSGTYVRSLGRDLAESLGTGAVMSGLRRTSIGPYGVENALRVEQLSGDSLQEQLLPPLTAVAHLPQIQLSEDQATEIRYGRWIAAEPPEGSLSDVVAATNVEGQLIAILRQREPGRLHPACNFTSPA
jgi:tRNA pseudouridine55 synthase